MDSEQWAKSFKLIHGKSPTQVEKNVLFNGQTSGCSTDEKKAAKQRFKPLELRPSEKVYVPSPKIKEQFKRILSRSKQSPKSSGSPTKRSFGSPAKRSFGSPAKRSFGLYSSESPLVNNMLKSPSPKKLLRPTNACSNIHFLIKEDEDKSKTSENDTEPVEVFEDELSEESCRMKKTPRERKKPASSNGFAPNYVKVNINRKRFVRKKPNTGAVVKKYKRFRRFGH